MVPRACNTRFFGYISKKIWYRVCSVTAKMFELQNSGKNRRYIWFMSNKKSKLSHACVPLKGPKHEIFESGFFTQFRPVRVGDLGTGEKNAISQVWVFWRFSPHEIVWVQGTDSRESIPGFQIGLSYRPTGYIGWRNRFLGSLNVYNVGLVQIQPRRSISAKKCRKVAFADVEHLSRRKVRLIESNAKCRYLVVSSSYHVSGSFRPQYGRETHGMEEPFILQVEYVSSILKLKLADWPNSD
jgi:hypothetical protein